MKKIFIFIITFILCINIVKAEERTTVTFNKCIDGDTAEVILNEEIIKIRLLAIDTPETKHPTIGEEPYGLEASNYTCESLKNADKIEIEYDNNSDKTDKYNRHLVWLFIDDKLLQEELIKKGFAEVAYLYDDYKYTSTLEAKQLIAKTKQIGMWNNSIDYIKIIIGLIIIIIAIILFFTNEKFRNKTTNKIKKKAKSELKKVFKN